MKKLLFFTGFLIAALALFKINSRIGDKPVIGILQTASHPALDKTLAGFIEELGGAFEVRIQNAEGLISQAQLIANHFHRDAKIKAIFTIATPATQAMAHVEHNKPIVFSDVTDPSVLGIPTTQTNITGVRDVIDAPKQISLLKRLVPGVRTVALLFNPGEVNSVALCNLFKAELKQQGLNWIEVGVHNEADIAIATRNACNRADAILTPTDNLVASTIQLIARIAKENKTPLIVSDNLLVDQGALASCGVDYHTIGKEAANIMRALLVENKIPSEIPTQTADHGQEVINQEIAEFLGIPIVFQNLGF